ncbi:MAG: MtrB/PioB family decaheme-associated outer membrane protein [Thermodesulfovibrionales bacterium]
MKRILIYTLMLCSLLLLTNSLYAEDNKPFSGEINAAGKLADINGNKAKFNEYRDIKDGIYGEIKLKYDVDKYFLKFKASDIGYDTQSYKLDGGMWGKFKLYLKYNEIPHNFTYDAKTIFSGAGTNRLTTGSRFIFATPSTYTPTNLFDYSLKRKQAETGVKIEMLKPFYVDVSFAREERDGIKPTAAALTTGGGSYFIEMPEPVDYVTDNLKAELGYAKNPLFLSLTYFYSEFSNDNQRLFFKNPYDANTFGASKDDYLTLPPDNKYNNISFKGKVKLPLDSALSVKLVRSETKSDYDLLDYYVRSVAGGIRNVTLSDSKFDGKLVANSYAVTLTSRPLDFLGAKVFYKYYDKDNKSDQISHTDSGVNGGNPFKNHLFDYKKKNYGVEFDVKLPASFSFMSAYSYLNTERHRGDLPETTDHTYSLALKWSGVDFMTAKVAYERLDRSAEHKVGTTLFATDQATANVVEKYIRRFDAAPMERDTYKASVDIYPLETLSFGLSYKQKKSDYTDTVLGLKEDKAHEYGIDADWKASSLISLNGYAEYEETKATQVQRYSVPAGTLDPNVAGSANSYNWKVVNKDKTYNYGAGAEVYAIPKKLTFKLQYDYVKSDGLADFSFFDYTPATTGDVSNVDDYRKTAVTLKTKYDVNKKLAVTAGYAYEQYKYRDIAVDGYLYTYNGGTNTSISSLTGAYSAPSYSANVVFAAVTYKF